MGLVQAVTGRNTSTGSPVSVTLPSAPTVGNLLVGILGLNSTSVSQFPATPSGWSSLLPATSGTATGIAMWFRLVDASTTATFSVTPSGGNQQDLHLIELDALVNPQSDQPNSINTGTTQAGSQSVSTAAALAKNELVIASTNGNGTFTSPTHSAGWISAADSNRLSTVFRYASTAAVQSDTFSCSNSLRLFSGIAGVSGTAPVAIRKRIGWGITL